MAVFGWCASFCRVVFCESSLFRGGLGTYKVASAEVQERHFGC